MARKKNIKHLLEYNKQFTSIVSNQCLYHNVCTHRNNYSKCIYCEHILIVGIKQNNFHSNDSIWKKIIHQKITPRDDINDIIQNYWNISDLFDSIIENERNGIFVIDPKEKQLLWKYYAIRTFIQYTFNIGDGIYPI